jgi:imidazolonepropionase-like amidohydrolase
MALSYHEEAKSNVLHLIGGRLIDGTGDKTIENSLVIIKDNKIIYSGRNRRMIESPADRKIDCVGKTILPGLFDAHIHLGGSSITGYIPIDHTRKLKALLYSGVTSVLDLAAVEDWIFNLRDAEKKGDLEAPRIFTVGPCFTSPKGHGTEYGVPMAITPTNNNEARASVNRLSLKNPDLIKIIYEKGSTHYTSINFELMKVIIDASHKKGIKVVTHVSTLEQAKDAVRAGTDGLAHMIRDKEIDEVLMASMKRRKIFCIPTLAVYDALGSQIFNKNYKSWKLIPTGVCKEIIQYLDRAPNTEIFKTNRSRWKNFLSYAQDNVKRMADEGIKLVLGTDAGNPAVFFGPSVHRELELLVESGLTPKNALLTATRHAAEILSQEKNLGTIEAGKLADILIINGNPLQNIKNTQNIFMVIKNGRIYRREKLAEGINPPANTNIADVSANLKTKIREDAFDISLDRYSLDIIKEAKAIMQQGMNQWEQKKLKKARDLFLILATKNKGKNDILQYYVALADFRLATYYIGASNRKEAETHITEGGKILEELIEKNPDFGEGYALYASFLGYEIALNNDRAMLLGYKSTQYYLKALEKDSKNPRIYLLKGASLLYTPEVFGGGANNALKYLKPSIEFFNLENIENPIRPSWGKAEAHTFMGLAYKKIKNFSKAHLHLKKALEINPGYRMALEQLKELEKDD